MATLLYGLHHSLPLSLSLPPSLSGGKVGSCILSNTCMGLGVEVISRLEQRLVGLQFSNLFEPLSADDPFNMAWVLGMLLLDSIVYMIIAWYRPILIS